MSIKVNYAALETAAGEVNRAQKILGTKVEEVEGQVQKLANTWEGEGREAFQVAMKAQNDAQKELEQALAQIETAIITAKERYADGEKGITNSFSA